MFWVEKGEARQRLSKCGFVRKGGGEEGDAAGEQHSCTSRGEGQTSLFRELVRGRAPARNPGCEDMDLWDVR